MALETGRARIHIHLDSRCPRHLELQRRAQLRRLRAPGKLTTAIHRFTGEMRLVSLGTSDLPRSEVPIPHRTPNRLFVLNFLSNTVSARVILVLEGVDPPQKWISPNLRVTILRFGKDCETY